MKYDEDLERYIYKYEDLIFAWENKPYDNFEEIYNFSMNG